jgi:hypothetical protein
MTTPQVIIQNVLATIREGSPNMGGVLISIIAKTALILFALRTTSTKLLSKQNTSLPLSEAHSPSNKSYQHQKTKT